MEDVATAAGGVRRFFDMDPQKSTHAPTHIQRIRPRPSQTLCAVLICFLSLVLCGTATARDLVMNGALSMGGGEKPTHWQADLWSATAGTEFDWRPATDDQLGVLVIQSRRPNDARWVQDVPVKPQTWYQLSGFVRATGVSHKGLGANLSILRGFEHAKPLKGNTGWTPVSMWFKTKDETRIKVACRLGSYGQESAGRVECMGIRLAAQAMPPPDADYIYGPVEQASAPLGVPSALAILVLLLWCIGQNAGAGMPVPRRETWGLAGLLLLIFAAKVFASPHFQYKIDIGTYQAWAGRLATEGPARFYAPNYFADYPPGYMYVLWGIGALKHYFQIPSGSDGALILLKLPALLADAAVTWLIWARLRKYGKGLAWSAALAFALNPALLLNSTVWGQTDSVLALLVLLALLAQGKGRFELAWILATLAVLTKPQALLLVPLLVFWPRGWWASGRPISCLLAGLATVYVVANPFRGSRPWSWLTDIYFGTTGYYAETSVNAMNLAALLFGMRRNDATTLGWFDLTSNSWGFIIGLAIGAAFFAMYLRRGGRFFHINLFAAASLVSFICLTRMHERYLYPFFVFAGLMGVTGTLGALYWSLSALFLANEWVVYVYQETASAGPTWLWRSVAALNTALMFAWFVATWRIAQGRLSAPGLDALEADDASWLRALSMDAQKADLPTPLAAANEDAGEPRGALPWLPSEIFYLIGLIGLALGLRVYGIEQPTDLVFDEVYFVEQARNYLNGTDFLDPHPPFAKLTIAVGIELFGDTPLGWRVMNAVVGTVLVGLVYLLGRELFQRRIGAGLASLFVAIDGLFLVDSRIAVIDIHYVTWAVLAFILVLRLVRRGLFQSTPRLLLIGAILGLSVGSKLYIPFFSFLLVLATIAVTGWTEAKKRDLAPVRFLARPILVVGWTAFGVYVSTYTPHFLWGWWHSPIDLVRYIFVEVPNYQSAVADATHPYSSKWYTWPLLLRPVWYFWKDPGPTPGTVVGIWGAGNPAIWWAAVPALALAAWHAVRERTLVAGFITAGWIIHLAPWVGIGRTLFLYHYLPSLLFAFLALAWLLDRLWHAEGSKVERSLAGTALLASLFPVVTAVSDASGAVALGLAAMVFPWLVFSGRADPARLGRTAVGAYAIAVLWISWYFLPIWLGTPVSKQLWQARMWISTSGIVNWI